MQTVVDIYQKGRKWDMEKQNVFAIDWNKDIPKTNTNQATKEEIAIAMKTINRLAKTTRPGQIIEICLRSEVAKAVMGGIHSAKSGAVLIDTNWFDAIKGVFISTLRIAKDRDLINIYLNNL